MGINQTQFKQNIGDCDPEMAFIFFSPIQNSLAMVSVL